MKTRANFECHSCGGIFGKAVDLEGDPVLMLECPYCGAVCKVDLAPHKHVSPVPRSNFLLDNKEHFGRRERYFELPDTIPTFAIEEPGEAG